VDYLTHFNLIPHDCSTVKRGDKFGRLTILEIGKSSGTYRYMAICQCECGNVPLKIRLDGITRGGVVSCGCYHKEVTATKGGHAKSPLGHAWRHIMDRCYNPNVKAYKDYGGRGIKVCDRWHDFLNFYADMHAGRKHGLEIDRRDNDGDYSPENCHWVTRQQNCNNRRNTRKITFQGKTQSMKQWSTELGLDYGMLVSRLRNGWGVERALTTPSIDANQRMEIARRVQLETGTGRWAKGRRTL
jgi:hypothetical protein